jgi:N-acetylmuramoyl-L-alanine amidase
MTVFFHSRRLGRQWLGSVLFALMLPCVTAAATALHVLVDPGHGGIDTGAVRGSLRESEIALKVSILLAEILREDPRFKVSMTRTTDESVALNDRTRMAREMKADVFLSIHVNSSQDARARGKEFYFQNQLPADEEAMFLASRENKDPEANESATNQRKPDSLSSNADLRLILEDLNRNYRIHSSSELSRILLESWASNGQAQRPSRAIRQAPFRVVSDIHIPSVLVELGFLTNPQEGPRLAAPDYQKSLAKSLYQGLIRYKETMDKGQ